MAVDMERFLQDLRDHAEWREELRRLVLADDLRAIGRRLDGVDDGLADLRATLRELVAASVQQQATLAQQQQMLSEIVEVQQHNSADLAVLIKAVSHLSDRTGWLEGVVLEEQYQRKGFAFFQRIAKKLHVLDPDELLRVLDAAVVAGSITDDQADEVRLADVVLRGRRGDAEVWLVVEVSYTIGNEDVDRAVARAGILARTGREVLPVVAGKRAHADADASITELGVWRVVNGRVDAPPER